MKYLENEICNFKIIGNTKITLEKHNILSSSLFRMKKHYKNFSLYINGLNRWIKFLNSFSHDYILRLFIDKNIYNNKKIMDVINSSDKIEPVLFTCSSYINGGYHFDLFGTLIRFFPYFDFNNNDSKNVIVVDIDLYNEDYRRCKYLIDNNMNVITGIGTSRRFFYENKTPYIYAGVLSNSIKFDKNIIINFIKNAPNIIDTGFYNKRLTTFGYGIDEIFVNKYLLNNVNKKGIIIEYDIHYFIHHSKERIMRSKNTDIIFKYILGKYYENTMTKEDMFDFIGKNVYKIVNYNYVNNYLSKRFYTVIKYLHKNKNKWLERNIINIINTHLNNIISGVIVFIVSDVELIDVITYGSVYVK